MSGISRRAFLESTAAMCIAGAASAAEPLSPSVTHSVPVSKLRDISRERILQVLLENTVHVETAFARSRRHSTGFVLDLAAEERGPKFEQGVAYILTCRHGMIHTVDGLLRTPSRSVLHVRNGKSVLPCNVTIDIHEKQRLSDMPDVALMTCYYPEALPAKGMRLAASNARVADTVATVGYASRTDPFAVPIVRSASVDVRDNLQIEYVESGTRPVMILDTRVRPGNSGGPVVSRSLESVGMIFGIYQQEATVAVPVSDIRDFLRRHGIIASEASTDAVAIK